MFLIIFLKKVLFSKKRSSYAHKASLRCLLKLVHLHETRKFWISARFVSFCITCVCRLCLCCRLQKSSFFSSNFNSVCFSYLIAFTGKYLIWKNNNNFCCAFVTFFWKSFFSFKHENKSFSGLNLFCSR